MSSRTIPILTGSGKQSGKALVIALWLAVVFAVSSLAGYYILGPVITRPSAPAQQADQPTDELQIPTESNFAPPSLAANPQRVEPSLPKINVEIDEPPSHTTAPSSKAKSASTSRSTVELEAETPSPENQIVSEKPDKNEPERQPQPDTDTKPAVKAAPPSKPKTEGKAVYRVQVGVYSDEDNAIKAAKELKDMGQQVHYVKEEIGGKTVYRIQAGLFKEKKNADALSQKLKEQGIDSTVTNIEIKEKAP